MNIFKFINSKDIRNYLKEISYDFTPQEVAWLIWQSCLVPIEEKYDAWEELIEKTPDSKLQKRYYLDAEDAEAEAREVDTLHTFIKEYIRLEKKYTNIYFNMNEKPDTPSVYRIECNMRNKGECDIKTNRLSTYFASYEDAYEALEEEKREVVEDDKCEFINARIQCFEIGKPGHLRNEALFNEDLKMVSVDLHVDDDNAMFIFSEGFFSFWFEFPTPFKMGDIIYDPNDKEGFYPCCGPMVVVSVGLLEGKNLEEQEIIKNQRYHDYSDMIVRGFFQKEDGTVYYWNVWNYMNYEFYTDDLDGKRRVLNSLRIELKQYKYNNDKTHSVFGYYYKTILEDELAKVMHCEELDEIIRRIGKG